VRHKPKISPTIVKRISIAMIDAQPTRGGRYERVHEDRPLDSVDGDLRNRIAMRIKAPPVPEYGVRICCVNKCPGAWLAVTSSQRHPERIFGRDGVIDVVPLTVSHFI
jgi:hypothetical protein